MKFVILYGSNEGQTEKIASYMVDVLYSKGHFATAFHLKDLPTRFDLTQYDAVLIGASIHAGQYQDYVVRWIQNHRAVLDNMPNGFFSVCLTAKDNNLQDHEAVEGYISNFIAKTGWQPKQVESFAGALRWERYGWFKRLLMRNVVKSKSGENADTSRSVEFTDWDGVKAFALSMG